MRVMGAALQVRMEHSEGTPVVLVAGEIDMSTAPDLRGRLEEIPPGAASVVVDLSEVTFLDSTGLSVLIGTWKRLSNGDHEADLRLVVDGATIRRVLDVTGLSGVFSVFPSLEEALAS